MLVDLLPSSRPLPLAGAGAAAVMGYRPGRVRETACPGIPTGGNVLGRLPQAVGTLNGKTKAIKVESINAAK